MVEIKEGHYGDVRLDGISVVTTFRFGEWVKLYVSENATDEQAKAAAQLMKFSGHGRIVFKPGEPFKSVETIILTP